MSGPGPFELTTPVALLVFSRPETTARVFEAVRAARPRLLLVVADGPRPDRPGEAERCAATRAVIERVDWPCEVRTHYAERNLGCRLRVSSGLDWVFDQAEEAVILEDDCVPHPTFFRFAQEMLARHRHDDRVGVVSGNNFQVSPWRTGASYGFSRYPFIWGWATWRRTWRRYDVGLGRWPALRYEGWLRNVLGDAQAERHWTRTFDRTYRGETDTWDYQLTFMLWAENQLNVLPAWNLVTNVGFGEGATHVADAGHFLAAVPAEPMSFPLVHPTALTRDVAGDQAIEERIFSGPKRDLRSRLRRRARKIRKALGSRG